MPPLDRSLPAETLRAFRTWLGLSQHELASVLGISLRSVQIYEGQGGPEWLRYVLLGWATLVHGATPRAAARRLGLPWQHHALSEGAADPFDGEYPDDVADAPQDPASDFTEGMAPDVDDVVFVEEPADLLGGRRGRGA